MHGVWVDGWEGEVSDGGYCEPVPEVSEWGAGDFVHRLRDENRAALAEGDRLVDAGVVDAVPLAVVVMVLPELLERVEAELAEGQSVGEWFRAAGLLTLMAIEQNLVAGIVAEHFRVARGEPEPPSAQFVGPPQYSGETPWVPVPVDDNPHLLP